MFQPLLRNLHQISTEHFVKPVVVHDFCGAKMSLPLALQVPELDWVAQTVIILCLSPMQCQATRLVGYK